jgi:hypothetical protein
MISLNLLKVSSYILDKNSIIYQSLRITPLYYSNEDIQYLALYPILSVPFWLGAAAVAVAVAVAAKVIRHEEYSACITTTFHYNRRGCS